TSVDAVTISAAACQSTPTPSNIFPATLLEAKEPFVGGDGGVSENELGRLEGYAISSFTTLICPVPGYYNVDFWSVTVDVSKVAPDGIKTKACLTYATGYGGACGAEDTNTSCGVQHIVPSISAWLSPYRWSDSRFVLVTMKASIETESNALFGYRQN